MTKTYIPNADIRQRSELTLWHKRGKWWCMKEASGFTHVTVFALTDYEVNNDHMMNDLVDRMMNVYNDPIQFKIKKFLKFPNGFEFYVMFTNDFVWQIVDRMITEGNHIDPKFIVIQDKRSLEN